MVRRKNTICEETIKSMIKNLHTQLVASNIFNSSGSPVRSPLIQVNEWQLAIATSRGEYGCMAEESLIGGRKIASSFPENSVGITPQKSKPSLVSVPV